MSLDALARGLRSAGGILNPEVQKINAGEDEQDRVAQRQETMLKLKSALDQAAQQASPQYQMQQEALKNERGFREAWGKLPPNASMLERANIAGQYGKPEISVQLYNGEQQRLTQLEARKDALTQRMYEFEQRSQDRNLDRESKERLAAQADETKRLLGTMTAEIAKSGQDLRLAILDFTMKDKVDKETRGGALKLGTALEKANLPEADATLTAVEDMLKKNPQIAEYITGPKHLLPDALVGKEITDARQAFNKLFNITLKLRSGAAVTQQELDRLKQEFAVGVTKKPEQVEEAIKQARTIITKHYRSVAGGYGPNVLKAYNENIKALGGRTVVDVPDAADTSDPLGLR